LFGSILIDNKDADASLQKTEGKAEKFFKKLGGGIKTAAKVGAAIGGMAIAGGAALFGLASKSAEATDRIDKLSQKIGISREGFQEWDFILSQSGTDIEKMQVGMKTMTQRMDEATKGTGKGAEAFSKLGIEVTDLNGNLKSQEEVFEETVKRMQEMPEGAEKSQLAFEMFGKAGLELMPLLNSAGGSVDELKQKAADLGLVLSDEAIDAGVQFTDTMDQMKRAVGAMGTEIGVAVMPIIQGAAEWIIAHMPQIKEVASAVFKGIADFVRWASDVFTTYFLPVIVSVVNWVSDNWPTIKLVIENVLNTVKDIISAVTQTIKDIWDKWGDQIMATIKTVWDIIKNAVETTMNVVKGIIQTVTSLIKGDWGGVWNGIKSIFTSIWDGIKGYVDTVINAIKGIIKNVTDSIKTTWSNVWNSIKDTTGRIWDGIKSAIMTPIEWVRDKVKGVIDTIKGFFNFKITWPKIPMPHFAIRPSGWKIGDLLRGSIPTLGIDWYAEGGIFDKPTLFNTPYGLKGVGEAGPEVVAPLSRLQSMLDFNNNADLLAEVIEVLKEIRDKNQDLYLDGERLVGYLIDYVDERLGEKQRQNELAFGGA
jgi:hypothetical protein